MTSFQPISVPRLYRMIANQIKAQIESGTYRPGERLPSERELTELLDVSRPSVREALIALEIEGYVEVRVGTGVFVAQPAAAPEPEAAPAAEPAAAPLLADVGAHDLLEARLLIEPYCAELAAKNATAEQLKAMEAAVLALPGSRSPNEHNDSLHLAIAQASGNVALDLTMQHLWKLSQASAIFNKLNQHLVGGEVWNLAHLEHLALLRALLERKPLAARDAMHAHLAAIRDRLGLDAGSDRDM